MPQGYDGLPSYYVQSSNPKTLNVGFTIIGMDPIIAENFVLADAAIGTGGGAVTSVFGRTGAVIAQIGDYSYAQISGTPQLPITKAEVTSNWLSSYDSTTGMFTASQPAYSDISGTPQLPVTIAAVSHQFLTSYTSSTGVFTQTQPSASDLSNGVTGTGAVVLASAISGFGSGTVTSFSAGSLSPLFTTSVATSATTPALSFSLSNAAQNSVLAGPTSGTGAPAYRSLVAADVPTLPYIATSLLTTLGDIIYENATPATARLAGNTTATKMYLSQTGNGTISAAPAWAQVNYADIAGTTPTPPSGSVLWSALGNAGANLTLSNAAFTTTFNQTSNAIWLWNNTTVATSGTTNASPLIELGSQYWNGSASAQDTWSIGSSLAAGTNGVPSLNITHSGSIGVAKIVSPATLGVYGWAGGTGGVGPGGGGNTNQVGIVSGGSEVARFSSSSVSGNFDVTIGGGVGSVGKITLANASGTITKYNNIATVSGGVPSELATVDLTGQVAAISATTLYTPTVTGMFRISTRLKITHTGTSPVLGPITITYTDGDDSVAQSDVMQLATQAGASATSNSGNTTTSTLNGEIIIYAKTGVAIQYAIALTGTVGTATFSAHLKCEAL